MIIKDSIEQKDITIVNIYAFCDRSLKYMSQNLKELKGKMGRSTVIAEDFNPPLSIMGRTIKYKISKKI